MKQSDGAVFELYADLNGEASLEALDRHAPSILSAGRPDQLLLSRIDGLLRRSLRGHPWSQLVVAAALWDIRREDPQIPGLVDSASRAFKRNHDRSGLGYVAFVRGNFALGQGRLEDAARWWEQCREVLGENAPCSEMNMAFLSLNAYQRGHLDAATRLAEEALALSRLRAHYRAEGLALVFVAFFSLASGAFRRAEAALSLAEQAWSDVPRSEDVMERPLLHGARGVLSALRGQTEEARDEFDRAQAVARALDSLWHGAIAGAAGAEFLARLDPPRARADARAARETFQELGDEWFKVWALRAEGVAARACGGHIESETILTDTLTMPLNPIDRAWTQLALGETLIAMERSAEATSILTTAAESFAKIGMRYWQARAAALLATTDGPRRALWHRRAQALREDDPAYDAIFARPSNLAIRVVDAAEVAIGEVTLEFQTHRAFLMLLALAIAGRPGLHADELIEHLWPDVAASLGRHRLRTVLWEARKVLGNEAWRVVRKRDRVAIDLTDCDFDLERLRKEAEQTSIDGSLGEKSASLRAIETLEEAVLVPPWREVEWVVHEQAKLRSFTERIRLASAVNG